ncbi:MAG TPA: methylmalonyl-CoA mutase family protein, partial [Candidatus Limnocylindria bacterium]|nr:methylmalonyl-CoA mutase family protein [Candidatus Limnocylindria bacterium]
AQSLHTNALDEALGLPTPATARLALRTQQVLAHESGVVSPVDPLGGSWYVEALTNALEERVLAALAEIDRRGGTLAAIREGYQQGEIAQAAYEAQRAVEAGESIIVGLNAFTEGGEEQRPAPQAIDPEAEARQVERTRQVRATRNQDAARAARRALGEAARGTENVLPRILACVEAQVTLGEISDELRAAWGEHRP